MKMSNLARMTFFRATQAALISIILLVAALWLAACWTDPARRLSTMNHLSEWLQMCPENGLRFVCNVEGYDHLYGYIDLQRNTLGVGGDDYSSGGITLTVIPGEMLGTSIATEQKPELERAMKALPPRMMGAWEKYDFNKNIYVTIRGASSSSTYVYSRNEIPPELYSLFKFFAPNVLEEIKKPSA